MTRDCREVRKVFPEKTPVFLRGSQATTPYFSPKTQKFYLFVKDPQVKLCIFAVAPLAGAWIEILKQSWQLISFIVAPSRGRGLKYNADVELGNPGGSPPSRGVLLLHRLIAEETGGSIGVRDEALLDSALENAFAGFGEQEFYPTKEEKGARLGYTLISNHAFVDGNKRIGMYVMLTFLEVNGIHMECTNEEVVEVGLSVASGTMDYDALLQWVQDRRI